MSVASGVVRVAMPCTGLGQQRRGFEAFTRDVREALRDAAGIEIVVYGGGGDMQPGERSVWNLPRASRAARTLERVTGRGSYFVEQASFFAGFLPHLLSWRPQLVYFGDLNLGNACWHWRRLTGQRFGLLYYNGGATTRPYTRCDWIQQLTPAHFDDAVARGEEEQRMVLLPHGVRVPPCLAARDAARVAATRRTFGAPEGRPLLLSVGMRDRTIKRMDVLIDAVAALDTQRPHLVMLGEEGPETPVLAAKAAALLGDAFWMGVWPRERMAEAYEAADAFALLSLEEGFGLAYVEALAAGLPCVAHDTPSTRHIFGDLAFLGDTTVPTRTIGLLQAAVGEPTAESLRVGRHRRARERFSWDVLAPRYADLLRSCAAGHRPSWSGA